MTKGGERLVKEKNGNKYKNKINSVKWYNRTGYDSCEKQLEIKCIHQIFLGSTAG